MRASRSARGSIPRPSRLRRTGRDKLEVANVSISADKEKDAVLIEEVLSRTEDRPEFRAALLESLGVSAGAD